MEEKSFQELLGIKTAEVQQVISKVLERYLKEKDELPYVHTILEAMEYSFMAGGKRLRPLLMRETYQLLGGEGEKRTGVSRGIHDDAGNDPHLFPGTRRPAGDGQ